MKHSSITASLLALTSHRAVLARAASCDCGYTVNRTTDRQFALFTDYTETDFLHSLDLLIAGEDSNGVNWRPQVYNTSAKKSRGEFGTSKQLENVIQNRLPEGKWGGEPAFAGDAGQQLWVRHEVENGLVPIAEIASPRDDMLYGSFRAAIKFTGMNGTCGAFFWYRNDTQEIDMEFLSRENKVLNLVVHSPDSDKPSSSIKGSGDNIMAASNSSTPWSSIVDFPQGFHEYRFDWMPDRIDFYVDSFLAWTTTKNIPDSPGHLMLSHWSNGNPNWSAGPPMEDAVMTVGYVKAYFNTSTSRDQPREGCGELDMNTVCVVPDQTSEPEPNGKKTHFYSMWKDEHQGTTFVASGSDPKHHRSSAATFGMGNLVRYFVGAVSCLVYHLT